MPFTDAYEAPMLDWVLGGATPTRPASFWVSFATGTPTDAGASDGAYTPRCTVTFGAAASSGTAGVKTNLNAISATVSGVNPFTCVGWNLYNSSVGGVRIAHGTVTAAIGCKSGDTVSFPAGQLKIILS
jgi:hypothetical protein